MTVTTAPTRTQGQRVARVPARVVVLLALTGAVLLGALGGVAAASRPPSYPAEALVVVLPPKTESTSDAIPIAAVWAQAAQADALLGDVARGVGVPTVTLAAAMTAAAVDSAPLVSIKVSTDSAVRSARWANAVAAELVRHADRTPVSGFTLQLLTEAVATPRAAGSPAGPLVLAGAVVGALAGVSLAQLLPRLARLPVVLRRRTA